MMKIPPTRNVIRKYLREIVIAGIVLLVIIAAYASVCLFMTGSVPQQLGQQAYDYIVQANTGYVLPARYQSAGQPVPESVVADIKHEIRSSIARQLVPGCDLASRDYAMACRMIDLQLSGQLVIEQCSCQLVDIISVEINDECAIVVLSVYIRESERYAGAISTVNSSVNEYSVIFSDVKGRWRILESSRIFSQPSKIVQDF